MHRLVVVLLACLVTIPLRATIASSALTGQVTVGGKPAAGASVTLELRTAKSVRTATTNARGTYWLGALTPGEYDVTFARAGLTSLTRPVSIQLGRVARADAALEVSEEEESVTSTATTVSVADTTAITTHFSADELERVPLRRDVRAAEILAPVLPGSETIVDDTAMFHPVLLGEETLDEVTVVRGAQPIELDRAGGSVILARTRSGRDELFASLRGTYASGEDDGLVLEGAAGGRVVPDRLWFFGSGWGGDAADLGVRDLLGVLAKLTAQASPSHQLVAMHSTADATLSALDLGTTTTALRYTGVFAERLTGEAVVSRARGDREELRAGNAAVTAKVSYRLADHVFSAGGSRERETFDRTGRSAGSSFFAGDRWAAGRWTVDAGVRRQDDRTLTRVALAFDLRSDQGSHAIVASWGEYPEVRGLPGTGTLRAVSIGYTSSLESSGTARIDLVRFEGARTLDQIQTDVRYRLFDRFEAGGSYVYTKSGHSGPPADEIPEHLVSARVGVQLPVGGRELSAMVLERYDATTWTTDLGIRYELPIRRVSLTLAADATNLFDAVRTDDVSSQISRTFRYWARLRL